MYIWGLSTGSGTIVYSNPRAPVLLLYVALPGFPSISVSGPPPLWIFQYGTGSEDRRVCNCTCTKIHGLGGGGVHGSRSTGPLTREVAKQMRQAHWVNVSEKKRQLSTFPP